MSAVAEHHRLGHAADVICSCHECGRTMAKAKKVHRGHRYCETCYARLFKRRLCPGCGNFSRLPVFDLAAVCRDCFVRAPCVRCHRTDRRVDKLLADGPVCSACAHHFREAIPCERCSCPSTQLVRTAIGDGSLRCCPRCRSLVTTSCCSSCRRPRVIVTKDGPAMCKRCFTLGTVPCPVCTAPMPGGRVKSCERCSWGEALVNRLQQVCAAFESARLCELVMSFAAWLSERRGPQFATLNLNRYLPFLETLDSTWKELPDYRVLVEHVTPEGLRRVRLVVRWLEQTNQLHVDPAARERTSEIHRIQRSLEFFPEGIARESLRRYHAAMMQRVDDGRLKLRSLRQSLAHARRLLFQADKHGQRLPDQREVLALLRKRPGLFASLYGVVAFLNGEYSCGLDLSVTPRWRAKAAHLEQYKTLLTLFKRGGEGQRYEREWISVALAYFHGLGRVGRQSFQYRESTYQGYIGYSVRLNGEEYWVPGPMDDDAQNEVV